MSNVLPFERAPRPSTKACKDCRHMMRDGHGEYSVLWKCGVNGRYCTDESRSSGGCGSGKLLWEPRPPSFWKRFGDAIIERIKVRA